MIQILIYIIYLHFLILSIECLRFDLQYTTMTNDFTLESISSLFQSIPFNIPTLRLCLGTPNNQCLNLIISTITGDSIIERKSTKFKCFESQFDQNASQTFDNKTIKVSMGFPLFDSKSHYFSGGIIRDVIGFPNQSPLNNKYQFAYVESSRICSKINAGGYLGMKKHSETYSSYSFLDHLSFNKVIDKQSFSLHYNSDNTAMIDFGEDIRSITNNTCSTNDDNPSYKKSWFCNLTRVSMGNLLIEDKKTFIKFSSVQSAVIAPNTLGKTIMDHIILITGGGMCGIKTENKHLILICDKKLQIELLPPLRITMEKAEMVIEWKHLMRQIRVPMIDDFDDTLFFVSLFIADTTNESSWIVGLPGLIDHTIVFDRNNLLIGIDYKKATQTPITEHNNQHKGLFMLLSIILISGIGILFLNKKVLLNQLGK